MSERTDVIVAVGKGVFAAAILAAFGASGCVQTIKPQAGYTPADSQHVVSGNPDRDRSAATESESQLQATHWTVLEKTGPKPVRAFKLDEDQAAGATTRPFVFDLPLKEVELPDGKLRLLWSLRNYGGATVISSRDASTSRRNVAVTPADLAPLVQVLTAQVGPAGSVLPLARENMLVITCDKAQRAAVVDVLSKLDIPPKQVEITAKVFEVSQDFDFQVGVDILARRLNGNEAQTIWSTFNTQKALDAAAGAAPYQGTVINLLKAAEKAGVSVDASFQALQEEGLIKVVSSPRMTVAMGQTGYLLAGQELPVQTTSMVNNVWQIGTQYKPVGVQLYITPQSMGRDRVKLHTISIVSSVTGFTPGPSLSGKNPREMLVNPIIESREAETAVTVRDGDTLVISGLKMMRTLTRENKIPILGDIPVLEWLFKNERSQQQSTDLYFFVTPTLMGPVVDAR